MKEVKHSRITYLAKVTQLLRGRARIWNSKDPVVIIMPDCLSPEAEGSFQLTAGAWRQDSPKNGCPQESCRQLGSKDPGCYVTQVPRTEGAVRTWGVGEPQVFLEDSRMGCEGHGLV